MTTDKKSLESSSSRKSDETANSLLLETEDGATEKELVTSLNLHQAVESGNYELAKVNNWPLDGLSDQRMTKVSLISVPRRM